MLIRRAKLRNVNGNDGNKDEQFQEVREDILCQPNVTLRERFEITGNKLRHQDCNAPHTVGTDGRKKSKSPGSPINNYPRTVEYDGGMTDAVTLEIFSLRRQNAELVAKLQGANNKLTKALELMYSLRRFLQLWVFEGQGESYDQVNGRIKALESAIAHIECQTNYPSPPLEIPERWRKVDEK